MPDIKVAVINATSNDSVLTDANAQAAVTALQQQVTIDFAPIWGTDANLTFVPRGQSPPPGVWWLSLLDTSDQATTLGYHDLTSDGLPLGKVFVQTDNLTHSQWTVTASHELLEMLEDPDINLWAFPHPDATADRLYSYEVCDACESDDLAYPIGGILVSDFLYPAWFESFRLPGSTQFDKLGKILQPFQIHAGGYCLVYDIQTGTGYQQIFGDPQGLSFTPNLRPRVGSRRERRMTNHAHWSRSTGVHPACGKERWPVKTLSDADASQVAFAAPVATTVSALRQLPVPFAGALSGPRNNRSAPVELTVYSVTATLVGAKIEADGDVHLVIQDPGNSLATMIVEFPDGACVQANDPGLVGQMQSARDAVLNVSPMALRRVAVGGLIPAQLVNAQTGKLTLQPMTGTAQITGVGFFDHLHGQDGVAPNGIELHPVLTFALVTTPAPVGPPSVTGINPTSGAAAGGDTVTVTGTGFTGVTGVSFGNNNPASNVAVVSDTQLTATSPAGSGTVDLSVSTPIGTSATSSADQFTYNPPPGLPSVTVINPPSGAAAGGDSVTITGAGFTNANAVSFGTTAATSFSLTSDTEIIATSPAGTGTVDVTVVTPAGTSAFSAADQFTYGQ